MSTRPMRALYRTLPDTIALSNEGLILMNESLSAIAADEGAASILSPEGLKAGGPESGLAIPEEIRKLLNGMRDVRATITKRVKLGSFMYTCRFFPLRPVEAAEGQGFIALYVTRDSSVSDAVALLADDYNLTEREQEALKAIATGLTSKEIAARMNISPNTVKSFVRIIMLKMGIDSRAAIMSRLLEYSKGKIDTTAEEE